MLGHNFDPVKAKNIHGLQHHNADDPFNRLEILYERGIFLLKNKIKFDFFEKVPCVRFLWKYIDF